MTVSPAQSPFTPISRKRRVKSPKKKASARGRSKNRHSPKTRAPAPGGGQVPPDVATRSNANESPKQTATVPTVQTSPIDSSVIILDWDDTLLASTHLASLGYRLEVEQEFDPNLRAQLDKLESQVISVLERLISYCSRQKDSGKASNLVIITNAERGWVELSAKKFIPRVLPTLEKCHIVSARSTFEISGSGPFEWKLLAFYHKIQQSFGFRIPPPNLHPESPYAGYLQRLYESPEPQNHYQPEMPCPLARNSPFKELPDLDDFEDATTDSEEDPVQKPLSAKRQGKSLPGGGVAADSEIDTNSTKEDKENANQERAPSNTRKAPRAMLLDQQNAYGQAQHETVLLENSPRTADSGTPYSEDPYAEDPISPYHLYDAGLSFTLSPDHEETELSEKYVVSFGDSLAEKHAAYNVVQNMPNTILKTVKFLERPTISQLCKQLTLMELNLDYILEGRRAMDLVLNPNPE